jgi:hypothetical protein
VVSENKNKILFSFVESNTLEMIRAGVEASNLFREAFGGQFVMGADVE